MDNSGDDEKGIIYPPRGIREKECKRNHYKCEESGKNKKEQNIRSADRDENISKRNRQGMFCRYHYHFIDPENNNEAEERDTENSKLLCCKGETFPQRFGRSGNIFHIVSKNICHGQSVKIVPM